MKNFCRNTEDAMMRGDVTTIVSCICRGAVMGKRNSMGPAGAPTRRWETVCFAAETTRTVMVRLYCQLDWIEEGLSRRL